MISGEVIQTREMIQPKRNLNNKELDHKINLMIARQYILTH